MELSGLIGIEEEKMESAAQSAINYFEILVDTPGNWDTFIPKYVQVTVYFIPQFSPMQVFETRSYRSHPKVAAR